MQDLLAKGAMVEGYSRTSGSGSGIGWMYDAAVPEAASWRRLAAGQAPDRQLAPYDTEAGAFIRATR